MMRSPAVASNAIFLRASRERPRIAVPCVPESDDNEPREAAAPRRSAVPRLSNTFKGAQTGGNRITTQPAATSDKPTAPKSPYRARHPAV
jgi:hypothetical protein